MVSLKNGNSVGIAGQCCTPDDDGKSGKHCKRFTGSKKNKGCVSGGMSGGPLVAMSFEETKRKCEDNSLVMCKQSCDGMGCGYNALPVWSGLPCRTAWPPRLLPPPPPPTPTPTDRQPTPKPTEPVKPTEPATPTTCVESVTLSEAEDRCCEHIQGDLTFGTGFGPARQEVDLVLACLKEVVGDVMIDCNKDTALTSLSMPNLRKIGGSLKLVACPKLTRIGTPTLSSIGNPTASRRRHRHLQQKEAHAAATASSEAAAADARLSEASHGEAEGLMDYETAVASKFERKRLAREARLDRLRRPMARASTRSLLSSAVGLVMDGLDSLTSFDFPSLGSIFGGVSLSGLGELVTVGFDALTDITDDMNLDSLPWLQSLVAPVLSFANGLNFQNLGSLSALALDALTEVTNTISFDDVAVMDLSLGGLVSAGGVLLSNLGDLADLSLASLTDLGNGGLLAQGVEFLTNLDLSTLTTSLGDLLISAATAVGIDMSGLTTAFGDVSIADSCNLYTLSLDALKKIKGNLDIAGNCKLETVTAPLLQSVGLEMDFANDESIKEILMPALEEVGDVIVVDMPKLVDISWPRIKKAAGDVRIEGNPELGGVNFGKKKFEGVKGDTSMKDNPKLVKGCWDDATGGGWLGSLVTAFVPCNFWDEVGSGVELGQGGAWNSLTGLLVRAWNAVVDWISNLFNGFG